MKKLSSEQRKERDKIVAGLRDAGWAASGAIATYNGLLEEAKSLRDEIVEAAETYADERSEKWQDSDAGQRYREWKDEWAEVELEEIEADFEHADLLEAMRSSPDDEGG